MNHAKNHGMNRMESWWFFFGNLGIGTSNESLVLASESSLNRVTKKWTGFNTTMLPPLILTDAAPPDTARRRRHLSSVSRCKSGCQRGIARMSYSFLFGWVLLLVCTSTCPGPLAGQPKHTDKLQTLKQERVGRTCYTALAAWCKCKRGRRTATPPKPEANWRSGVGVARLWWRQKNLTRTFYGPVM